MLTDRMLRRGPFRAVACLGLFALAPLSGCVSIEARGTIAGLACAPGETRQDVAQMFFGRNIGQTVGVSEEAFARFLDEVVTPRFPDGLSVQDGQGRWLYKGVDYHEPGKMLILILVHPDDRAKVREIAAAYEARFRQDAVLIVSRPSCVEFHMATRR